MKVTVLLLALARAFAFAVDNAVIAPQAAVNLQSTIASRRSPVATNADAITIPQMLSYQGRLTDTLGVPVPDGNYPMMFLLYSLPSGGSSFWSETQSVTVKDGLFSAMLGSATPIVSMPDAGTVYLAMTVSGGPELTPRIRIASSAFAYLSGRAADADQLQGKDTMAFDARYVDEGQASSVTSAMLVDGTIAAGDLDQMGAASGQVMKWTGSGWQPRNDSLGTADNAWVRGTPDSVLYTVRQLGIVRGGASNALYGNLRYTHTDFGVGCTTGYSGLNYGYAAIGGGQGNLASASHATVSGGLNNRASGYIATVGGGQNNTASGDNATVGGGSSCNASWIYTTVGGGRDNTASNSYSTVGGGRSNSAVDAYATVAGGWSNSTSGDGATVGGGYSNYADSNYATVAGGYNNGTHGYCAAVGGGTDNNAVDDYATVGGGYWNYASGSSSTIPGGYRNYVYGDYATVIGGANDSCGGDYSLVAGSNVRVRGWAPYTLAFGENCSTSVPRAVVFYHSGAATKMGVGVQTPTHNIDVQGGAYCNGTNWVNGSSRRLKTDVSALTPGQLQEVLRELERTQVVNYRYRSESSGEVHIGLIAEDAPELLATPERDGINTADAIGFLLAAVKAQQAEIEALKSELNRR